MFYIYRSFSIAGWIAAAAFFVFLFGFQWGQRRAARRRREPEPRGFDVTPSEPTAETNPTTPTANEADAKHP